MANLFKDIISLRCPRAGMTVGFWILLLLPHTAFAEKACDSIPSFSFKSKVKATLKTADQSFNMEELVELDKAKNGSFSLKRSTGTSSFMFLIYSGSKLYTKNRNSNWNHNKDLEDSHEQYLNDALNGWRAFYDMVQQEPHDFDCLQNVNFSGEKEIKLLNGFATLKISIDNVIDNIGNVHSIDHPKVAVKKPAKAELVNPKQLLIDKGFLRGS